MKTNVDHHTPQEELDLLTNNGIDGDAHTSLPPDMKLRSDCLNFHEKQI
jgi:hypothetical protein